MRGRLLSAGRRCGNGSTGDLLELVEKLVEILAVEDEAGALCDRNEMGSPLHIESSPLDADVDDGFQVGQAALHGLAFRCKGSARHTGEVIPLDPRVDHAHRGWLGCEPVHGC